MEPFHDCLHRVGLLGGATGLETVRILGTDSGRVDDCVAPDSQVVVEGVGRAVTEVLSGLLGVAGHFPVAEVRWKLHLSRGSLARFFMGDRVVNLMGSLVAPLVVSPLVIRAGGEDGWDAQPLIGFNRPDDLRLDEVGLPIKVGIHVGLNVDHLPDEPGGIEAGQGLTVEEEGLLVSR